MATSSVSRGRLVRRLVTVAAAVGGVLAGIAPGAVMAIEPFDSNTDMGALRLQLGLTTVAGTSTALPEIHDPSPPRFVYETKAQPGRTNFEQLTEQYFVAVGKCGTALDSSAAAVELATLTSGPFGLGIGPDSLGVYDGPRGVACYRISAGPEEWIQFGIGDHLKEIGARSFYRLELDIEVKQNAKFELQVLRGGEIHSRWVLETGSSIGTTPAATVTGVTPCLARSDSGPDAGPGDNCRWTINDLGDGFKLIARVGEGSLEGGGDFGAAAYANNTVIFLTDAEVGVLGCGNASATRSPYTSTIGDGVNSAQCSVTRVDPTAHGGACTENIPYLFRTLPGGMEGCELAKNPGEQMAAVINVVFPPEPRVELNGKALTVIVFPNPAGGEVPFEMPRCAGTLDLDANDDGVRFDGVSPDPTIDEVLSSPGVLADFFDVETIDQVPGNDNMEWACILEDEEDYVGDDLMRVRQKVLFWGDPIITRF